MGGTNDMTIIAGIIILFIAVGALIPLIKQGFSQTDTFSNDVEGLSEEVGTGLLGVDNKNPGIFGLIFPDWVITTGAIIGSIAKMFFWTFGDLPFLLDLLLFVPLRILLALIIARNVWVGGGG